MINFMSKSAISKMIAVILGAIVVIAVIAGAYYYMTLPKEAPPTVKNQVVIAQLGDALHLNPGTIQMDGTAFAVISDMYEGLIQHTYYEAEGGKYLRQNVSNFEGRIAESWTVSDDYKVWTFKIRHNLKFHSGNPITAEDVVWSLKEYHFNQFTGTVLGIASMSPEGVELIDDYTVRVTCLEPMPALLQYICQAATGVILDKDLVILHGGVAPFQTQTWVGQNDAGSGPYKLDHWTPGVEIVLTAFEDYWREGWPRIPKVVFRIIPDASTQTMLLQTGDVDVIPSPAPKDVKLLMNSTNINVINVPGLLSSSDLMIRTENVTGLASIPFTDKRVVEALLYTVPYDAIINNLLYGFASRAGSISPVYWPMVIDSFGQYNYNLTRAKELLVAAGYDSGFSFIIQYGTGMSSATQDILLAWQSELVKVNVTLQITRIPQPQWLALYTAKQLSFIWRGGGMGFTGDVFYNLNWMVRNDSLKRIGLTFPGAVANPMNIINWDKDPVIYQLDEVWLQGQFASNPTQQAELAAELQNGIRDAMYDIPFYRMNFLTLTGANLRGLQIHLESPSVRPATLYYVST